MRASRRRRLRAGDRGLRSPPPRRPTSTGRTRARTRSAARRRRRHVVDPDFVTGATAPRGVAIDGTYIYWAHDGVAGRRARRATSAGRRSTAPSAQPDLRPRRPRPPGARGRQHRGIYWTQPHPTTPGNPGSIGRAPLGGQFHGPELRADRADPMRCRLERRRRLLGERRQPGQRSAARTGAFDVRAELHHRDLGPVRGRPGRGPALLDEPGPEHDRTSRTRTARIRSRT